MNLCVSMEDSDCFSLIDENDSLISSDAADDDASLTHLHSVEAIGDIGGDRVDGTDLSNKCGEQLPQLSETAEPEIPRKTGKLNLRKSLAWDKAFFESPGFLDAEEISTIIDGADKGKKHLLPGIDEDISRSTESISTLASENLALESLEDELFKDIRASIQKSSISTSNRKAAPKETDKLIKSVKVDITSRNGSARNVTSKRQTVGIQGSGRISKKDSTSALATQPGLRNGNSSSLLPRPPKVISKPEAMPAVTTKRAFLGANRIKTETNNSKVEGRGVQVHAPVAAGLAGARKSVPKAASLPKALGSASSGATIKEVGRSSCSSNSSKSTSTEKIQKSTSASARTKAISRPVIQASSKIPLSKKPPGKSGLPSSLTSSKNSLSTSPSSSIGEWSSASSTSTVNQKLTSRTSIDTISSCRSMDSETPSILCHDVQSNDGISDRIPNPFEESPYEDVKKTNAQNNVRPLSVLMKPSGLRMPSPKIGFFDGAKSVVHTPNAYRQSQLRLPTGLPKTGTSIRSPVGSSKKAEGNIPSGKKVISSATMVLNTSKSASPRPSQESSKVTSEVRSSNKGTGRPCPEMTLTSLQIELEGQKSDSPKSFQESASPGRSLEQSQSHLPTSLPKIRAGVHSPFGRSKKTEEKVLAGKKVTSDANTMIDTLNFSAPKPSPELSKASMKGHSNHRSVLSPDKSSEAMSSNEGSVKLRSKMILTSNNIELEGQKLDSVKPFQESAFASICDPIGCSEKEGKIPTGEKATAVASTVLDTLKSASPTPSQESSRVLMKCHDDTESVSSPNISSEMRSSNMGTEKPWPEMTLTSTNIELDDQKSEFPKPIQEIACPGVSQEQSHSQSPTSLPKIGAAVHSPIGSSKKVEGNTLAGKNTSGASTELDTSESAVPEPSPESSRDSKQGHGDRRSLISSDKSSEVTSSDKLSLTSTNIELEDKKSEFPKLIQEIACHGVSQEQFHSQSPTSLPKIGAAVHGPIGSSKKVDGNTPAGKNTSGADTVLDKSESAASEPSQESSRDSMKGHGDRRSLISSDISFEVTSSDEVTKKPCLELSLTSINIKLEDQKSEFPKLIQEIACPGVSQEQSHSQSPTSLPKIGAAVHSPIGSSKRVDGNTPAGKNTSGAGTVLDKSESAALEPSQESSRDSMKGHGDYRILLSSGKSSEVTSSDEVTLKPCSELSFTSKNSEFEGQKSDSHKQFQDSACPGVPQEQSQSQLPTCLPTIGTAFNSPVGSSKKAEEFVPSGIKTSGANTVLYTSESATPEPSQESKHSINGNSCHRSLLIPYISSEATSSDEVVKKQCSELSLTSTDIELEGKKSDSAKTFQESASFGFAPEHQLCLPTGLPKIEAAICNPVGSSKKEGNISAGEKATAGTNIVLDTSISASAKPSQESPRASMEGHGDPRISSTSISSEVRSSNMGSENIELEGQKLDFPKPFRECTNPGVSPEILSEIDISNCIKAEDVKVGKRATANAPEAENNENLLRNL